MVRTRQQQLLATLRSVIAGQFGITVNTIALEQPPNLALGEIATPVAFELAKRLRKPPRALAQELAAAVSARISAGELPGFVSAELAGAGYLNLRLDRAATAFDLAAGQHADIGGPGFRLIEHTSINPNKAAHIGHLRNAILGDTFQRMLRPDGWKTGFSVGVQNYIDNTGVQVADVVVGLTILRGLSAAQVHELLSELVESNQRIDYFCWDLYAEVSRWYTADPDRIDERKKIRLETLHSIERGGNEISSIADLIATAVLRRHLETMLRLGIEYDFLPRESEILSLHFWDAARQLMIEKGVLFLETEGKNAGCWVMRRAYADRSPAEAAVAEPPVDDPAGAGPSPDLETGPDQTTKVLVRSNGTVTYVGKDIAYHLWKFGLLPGKDFGYQPFFQYPDHLCWISSMQSAPNPPPTFGHAEAIYNVIDSRQNDPQSIVIDALRGMGFTEAADRYTHFSYEMVALTPRCALELGYPVSEEDQKRPFIEVSGRKGFGVKADDLLDRLIAAATAEVTTRHPELTPSECAVTGNRIAVGALRYFMLRVTRNTVIAFDFRDALSFEGETGPYIQYSIVRARNILRKAAVEPSAALNALAGLDPSVVRDRLNDPAADQIWATWLLAGRLSLVLEQSINAAEPAFLCRYAFQLAQQFNNFYHRHHVLQEQDPARRTLLLATAAVAARELTQTLSLLGIEAPDVM